MGLRNYRRLELSSVTWVWETTGDYSYRRVYGSGKLHEVTAILGYMGLGNYMRLQLSSDVLVWKNQDRLQLSLALWVWELRNTRGYIWCRVNVDLSLIGWVSKVLISLLCTRGCKEIGTHIFCCFKTSPEASITTCWVTGSTSWNSTSPRSRCCPAYMRRIHLETCLLLNS